MCSLLKSLTDEAMRFRPVEVDAESWQQYVVYIGQIYESIKMAAKKIDDLEFDLLETLLHEWLERRCPVAVERLMVRASFRKARHYIPGVQSDEELLAEYVLTEPRRDMVCEELLYSFQTVEATGTARSDDDLIMLLLCDGISTKQGKMLWTHHSMANMSVDRDKFYEWAMAWLDSEDTPRWLRHIFVERLTPILVEVLQNKEPVDCLDQYSEKRKTFHNEVISHMKHRSECIAEAELLISLENALPEGVQEYIHPDFLMDTVLALSDNGHEKVAYKVLERHFKGKNIEQLRGYLAQRKGKMVLLHWYRDMAMLYGGEVIPEDTLVELGA